MLHTKLTQNITIGAQLKQSASISKPNYNLNIRKKLGKNFQLKIHIKAGIQIHIKPIKSI